MKKWVDKMIQHLLRIVLPVWLYRLMFGGTVCSSSSSIVGFHFSYCPSTARPHWLGHCSRLVSAFSFIMYICFSFGMILLLQAHYVYQSVSLLLLWDRSTGYDPDRPKSWKENFSENFLDSVLSFSGSFVDRCSRLSQRQFKGPHIRTATCWTLLNILKAS